MNLKGYIKLIFEQRPPNRNIKVAMEMSDDELLNYLEAIFGVDETFKSQSTFYQYLRRDRKDVFEKLKAKRDKGIDYYRNIISKFKTLSELKSQYPNLAQNLYKKFGIEVTNDLLSGLERSPRRVSSQNVKAAMEMSDDELLDYLDVIFPNSETRLSYQSSLYKYIFKNRKAVFEKFKAKRLKAGRPSSQNVKDAVQMSDDELLNYLDEISPNSETPLASQPDLYQYLRRNRKDVLEKLKTKKGIDYYKNIISQFKTLLELRSKYPNLRSTMNKKLGKEVANDLLSGLERAYTSSQNVKDAMQMSDDELLNYLDELFPNFETSLSSQPDLYLYLRRNRKDVFEKLKAKRVKGLDYYRNIISKFKTLSELKSQYPNLRITAGQKFGTEVANDLFSGLERAYESSQNVKAAMQMSDDELLNYLDEIFPNSETPLKSQPDLYLYLRRKRKDVFEKLKAKRAKGIDYDRNIISKFKTLPELQSEYPNFVAKLYSKYGKGVANDLLSGFERGKMGRPSSQSSTQDTDPETIEQTINPYLRLPYLESILPKQELEEEKQINFDIYTKTSTVDRFEKHLDKIIDEVLNEAIQERADDIVQSINKRVVQSEQLVGGQKKLDKNKNHKIDSEDFKLMRMNKKRDMKEYTMGDVEPDNDVEPYGNFDTEKVKIGKVKNSGYKYEKKVGKEFNEEEMEEGRHSKKEREAFINYIKNSMGKRKEDRSGFDDRPSEVVGVYSNINKQRMEEEEETVEGNKFSGELAKAKKDGKKSFTVDGKTYPVKENTQSKPNTNVQLTEDELISLIEKLVLEQYMKPQKDTAKVGKENDTINKDHIDAMVKKMKQYLKDASEGEYEMNPENFPQGNGEMKEMPKKAYKASDAVEEYIDAFAYPGMTNLVYDEIKPNDEWIEANLKGSSKTGNAQVDQDGNALGNVVPTKTGEKMYKNFKDNVYGAEQMNASYKRYPQPVDQAGESTEGGALALKKGSQKSEKIFQKLESTEDKSQKLIKEQIDRMKNMVSYNQKTQ